MMNDIMLWSVLSKSSWEYLHSTTSLLAQACDASQANLEKKKMGAMMLASLLACWLQVAGCADERVEVSSVKRNCPNQDAS